MCFVVKPLYLKGWRVFNFHLTLQYDFSCKEDANMKNEKITPLYERLSHDDELQDER